ncbi:MULTISPECIES: DUF3016 domain-containing protein [unclassified Pseudoalteromonas]|nr:MULTISPECIES: DUF3016 domain-containing protein [unclassified Pseudoalteromonas]
MMKSLSYSLAIAALVTSLSSYAGEAKIKWHDLDDYTDARPANEVKGPFHKRLVKNFNKHFSREAENLPEGYVFNAEITNLDLAGDVRFGMNEIRVIKPIYMPKINFTYSVTDAEGKVVSEGEADLKDMQFMDRIRSPRANEANYYDFRLISSWFEKTLLPELGIEPKKAYR